MIRLIAILRILSRYKLIDLMPNQKSVGRLPRIILWLCGLGARKIDTNDCSKGNRLRLALQEMGPIYVKFGQLLSTRRDMLSEEIADELAKLQDKVEPFADDIAISIIESELGKSVSEAFIDFEGTPLASASVAQVYAAKLRENNDDVVVKVIRPNIEKIIASDIQLLSLIAHILEKYNTDARRLHLGELVNDYETIILAELDLKQEAANGSKLQSNFEQSDHLRSLLYVPDVYWDYSTEEVLVMERIYGVPISDMKSLQAHNTNLKLLAERGVEIFFTQVFEQNFFHADMHPGNIFIDINNPAEPRYIALDCAIISTLSDVDRYYVARILLGALDRDYHLVAQLYVEAGWLKSETHVASFESLVRSVCEPVFSKPISELSFGTLLIYLFKAARRFGMEVQPSLVLLQKTLVNVEGLGQQLYPELDLWQTAQPFLNQWVGDNYSAAGFAKSLRDKAPALLEALPILPHHLTATLEKISATLGKSDQLLEKRIDQLESKLQWHKKLNITLLLIAVVWIANVMNKM